MRLLLRLHLWFSVFVALIVAASVAQADSGQLLAGPLDRIRFSGVSWLPDSQSFFYDWLCEGFQSPPATERFADRTRVYRRLDGREHVVFSASRAAELGLPPIATGYVFAVPGRPELAAASPTASRARPGWVCLASTCGNPPSSPPARRPIRRRTSRC